MTAAPTESTRALAPGSRIAGKLEIIRHLGEGGMGSLWVAKNLTTEAEVAIKVLRANWEDDAQSDAGERFRHEARLGAKLTHRNITRVFDLVEADDGALVLVMELLHGETLEHRFVGKGPLSCREAVTAIVPILGALQHAHDHGIVHRDIKPSNIFLHVDPDGHPTPKLLDFGIAKMPDSSVHTRAGDVLGTPTYMSPEQVRASKQLDGRSDLFSIGSLLYEMITGEHPFRTDSPSATLARVLEMEVDPDPRIEPRLWMELQRVLSKQPYERQATADDLAVALCAAVDATPPRSLRRDRSRGSDPKLEAAAPHVKEPTDSTDVDVSLSVALPKSPPPARLVVYGIAILLSLGGVLLIVTTLLRGSDRRSPELPAETLATASAAPTVPSPSGSVVDPAVDVQFEIPEARPGNGRPANPNRAPRRPLAPKPAASTPSVARTPGF